MAPAVNSAGFAWCGRPVNQFETGVAAQLKRSFTKRTAYRKQRAIIASKDARGVRTFVGNPTHGPRGAACASGNRL